MSWSACLTCPASSAEGIPGSLIRSRRRLALPVGNGSRLEPGGLSVPGDGRGSGRPDPG
jgi:hypothetical protein